MPEEIKTIDGGEAPASVRVGASSKGAKGGTGDERHQSGGEAPSPGYTPEPETKPKKSAAVEKKGSGDPPLGGVARKR